MKHQLSSRTIKLLNWIEDNPEDVFEFVRRHPFFVSTEIIKVLVIRNYPYRLPRNFNYADVAEILNG